MPDCVVACLRSETRGNGSNDADTGFTTLGQTFGTRFGAQLGTTSACAPLRTASKWRKRGSASTSQHVRKDFGVGQHVAGRRFELNVL